MKQRRSIISPALGTTTERMMICVEWTCCESTAVFADVTDGNVVAEVSAAVAEMSVVAEVDAMNIPWYVGND